MNREITSQTTTLPLVSKPPVESFFSQEHAEEVWPKRITARTDFKKQIADQHALLTVMQKVFVALPVDMTLATGIDTGLIAETLATDLLNRLFAYLKLDPAYERSIFYLPLELTSPICSDNVDLQEASNRFLKTYRTAWENQAKQHDVRANFVNGDVLEIEKRTGDPVRVVKATHLIPGLIQSGHMTFEEVVQYVEDTEDTLFKDGVYEACTILLDLEQITKSDLALLSRSDDLDQQESYHRLMNLDFIKTPKKSVTEESTLTAFDGDIAEALLIDLPEITANRRKWLQEVAIEKAISHAGTKLNAFIQAEAILPDPLELPSVVLRAYVDAVRRCVLKEQTLTQQHRTWLTLVKKNTNNKALSDSITKLYLHADTAGILSHEVLQEEQIRTPALQGPFSKNLNNFAPSVTDFEALTRLIADDAFLSRRVYPIVILLGSQLKGYGISNADADAAVFIRPGVPMSDLSKLEVHLQILFAHERIGGSAIMFWLDEPGGSLVVRETTQTTGAPPLHTWTHVLMGGAWVGELGDIQLLQHALLTPYLFNPTEVLDGKPIRERWLEEMERDSILYRLLHKGFERYYPVQSPMSTAHADAIDGSAVFYDRQFRRIATELFLTRVFFPNLG